MPLVELPIDAVLPEVIDRLREANSVVLRAPAGAGKTTRVPPALLDAGLAGAGQILMLQPRRVAARAAARRISIERGTRLGDETGYQVRFDEQISRQTRIRVVTEGILLRMLFDDPFLERLSVVVFDEFHERSLSSDLALGMVRRIQQTVRPDLKIVVMSATLAAEPIAAYLNGCPIVESLGRTFPVDISYLKSVDMRPIHQQAAEAVVTLMSQTDGDVLVFLPGVGEIRKTQQELESRSRNTLVMPLYGDLPPEQQDAVLLPCERRKIVLATNVAETSITVDGVTAVVDSGLARVPTFDSNIGLDRLELKKCSQASADQRAGRAGRTAPGVCVRLWDERSHALRSPFEEPEVRRVDLAGTLLQLWCWGERDAANFPWFEAPRPEAIDQAVSQLRRLGAIDDAGVTALGHAIARFPVSPRLGRLLIEGQRLGCIQRTALLAALLSERDPFFRGSGPGSSAAGSRAIPTARHRSNSDTLDRLCAIEDFARDGRTNCAFGTVNMNAARFVLKAANQFLDMLPPDPNDSRDPSDEAVMRALLAAFPDRLARRRGPRDKRGVLVGGRGVKLDARSAVDDGDLFLCIDVDAGQTDATVREASLVKREWLDGSLLQTRDELFFHPTNQRVAARRRTFWDDLVIEESTAPLPQSANVADVLFEAMSTQLDRVLPSNGDVAEWLLRARCLSRWRPDLSFPNFDEDYLRGVLKTLCQQYSTVDELKRAPWLDYLRADLTAQQQQFVQTEAPERIEVPSGSQIKLVYELDRPPVLAVRIQEIFGMLDTPRIAGGRVPVLMHLLAPNHRPEQITEDLKSFWKNAYPQVRKTLKIRYPKHAWPEDPLTALPESRPKKRTS